MAAYVYLDYDAEALAREYNNRAKVPDFQNIVQDWQQRSDSAVQAAQNSRQAQLDLRYGQAPRQRLDLFLPPAHAPQTTPPPAAPSALPTTSSIPLHVFIHGGYWQAMEKEAFNFLARGFTEAGIAFANLEYTLCPQCNLFDIIEEMRSALAFLYRGGPELGFDPDRIQISGHSAGGHLTAMLAATDWPAYNAALPSDLVKSALLISGIFDLEPLRHIPIGDKLALRAQDVPPLNPIGMPVHSDTKIIIALGALEGREFHRQAEQLAASYRAQGLSSRIVSASTRNHFTILEDLADPSGILFRLARDMIGFRDSL